jgi:arabinogalactan endo-1,4-beta-galactosidase
MRILKTGWVSLVFGVLTAACGTETPEPPASSGGTPATGGQPSSGGTTVGTGGTAPASGGTVSTGGAAPASGGTGTGGSATGGKATGGTATGGTATGGKATGGTATGGTATGGSASGGKATGGTSTGGTATGGKATGGTTGTGGSAGGCGSKNPNLFAIGADITDQEVAPDATRANLLTIMKSHGFNYVRLRTFVDPKASDGYDKTNGYDDITHTVAFGKQIKDACMGLLIDFHYSDNWADPGKQCVPVAWQGYTTIADLATAVHDYTKDAITKLIAGGARPDMVQIGNETTPGMLLHRCDSGGQPTGSNPITGSTSNWTNLGTLFKAGIQGVKDVDTSILISLHIDRGNDYNSSRNYINNAQNQGVKFDAFGESCYTAYQGQPSAWQSTFTQLSTAFPNLKLFIAEYGPEQRAANDIIFNLPNNQGLGTFNWEPTTQGAWNTGHDLLRRSGTTYTAQPDLALYDQMITAYASRL